MLVLVCTITDLLLPALETNFVALSIHPLLASFFIDPFQHCQFIKGNVPRNWPGFDFDPASASTTPSSGSGKDGLEIGIMVAIVLVAAIVVGLFAFVIVRKRKTMGRKKPAAAQNAIRDQAEALKLDADGSVLQEVMASMAHTPDLTTANGTYDFETADGTESVEVTEPYSDKPRWETNGGNGGSIPRSSTNSTNGSYVPRVL
jgi:competence protein ComGC